MPYIDNESRIELMSAERPFANVGELNYYLTTACVAFIHNRVMQVDGPVDRVRYSDINDVIGALECAKIELYRRLGEPVERSAIARNGDVYPEHLTGGSESADDHPYCGTDDCCGTCITVEPAECMDCGDDCGSCNR